MHKLTSVPEHRAEEAREGRPHGTEDSERSVHSDEAPRQLDSRPHNEADTEFPPELRHARGGEQPPGGAPVPVPVPAGASANAHAPAHAHIPGADDPDADRPDLHPSTGSYQRPAPPGVVPPSVVPPPGPYQAQPPGGAAAASAAAAPLPPTANNPGQRPMPSGAHPAGPSATAPGHDPRSNYPAQSTGYIPAAAIPGAVPHADGTAPASRNA